MSLMKVRRSLLAEASVGLCHFKSVILRPQTDRGHCSLALAFLLIFYLVFANEASGGWASRFSLSLGEEYNDNIFFEKRKQHDFTTVISPTFSILYSPLGQSKPIFTADLTPRGEIFARHGEESNFARNIDFNTEYTHYYSPRLIIYVKDTLQRLGNTRSGESRFETGLPPAGGATGGPPGLQRFGDFVSRGEQIQNVISTRGTYIYSPNVSFTGDYAFGYKNFIDQGGSDIWLRVGARGVYKWLDEHNLHFGYGLDYIKSRDGDSNIVHNIDIGDDYFSSLKLQLDPTLTIFGSTGIGIVTGSRGVRLVNRLNVNVTKLWQTATLTVGVNKGITPSLGVAGVSDTTSFLANFNIRLTQLLTGFVASNFSLFDTEDGNFETFTASTGMQYRILSWLASELRYSHRWRDSSAAVESAGLGHGKIHSNVISLSFTASFDVWPNTGFARGPALP